MIKISRDVTFAGHCENSDNAGKPPACSHSSTQITFLQRSVFQEAEKGVIT